MHDHESTLSYSAHISLHLKTPCLAGHGYGLKEGMAPAVDAELDKFYRFLTVQFYDQQVGL